MIWIKRNPTNPGNNIYEYNLSMNKRRENSKLKNARNVDLRAI